MNDSNQSEEEEGRRDSNPIPCTQCPSLALLLLDDDPLCRRCIIDRATDRDLEWIERHTKPLDICGPVAMDISTFKSNSKKTG
ncbi:MAG: hypothetical protein GY854_33425 [Deltaproteobacteria bacterium]|nr:hypothetical protein [Deltaproteobacteria bacterium]